MNTKKFRLAIFSLVILSVCVIETRSQERYSVDDIRPQPIEYKDFILTYKPKTNFCYNYDHWYCSDTFPSYGFYDIPPNGDYSRPKSEIEKRTPAIPNNLYFMELIPLSKKATYGMPYIFKVRYIFLRELTGRQLMYSIPTLNNKHLVINWKYVNSDNTIQTESVVAIEAEYDSLYIDKYKTKYDTYYHNNIEAGTVFEMYFAVPSPAKNNISQLFLEVNLRRGRLSTPLVLEKPIASDFVGDSENSALSFVEFQNLILYGQKKYDSHFKPLGEFGLENHLTIKELAQFENALKQNDPYAILIYMQFCYNQHDNWYNIIHKYKPRISHEEFESLEIKMSYEAMIVLCKLRFDVLFRRFNSYEFYYESTSDYSSGLCYDIKHTTAYKEFQKNLTFIEKNGYLQLNKLEDKTNLPLPQILIRQKK